MYISGLQKLTLLDYPEHLASILFLDGCNFRCPFCHNSELVLSENYEDDFYSEDEVLEFLKKRFGMLDGVCISGGEPTLHRDLPALVARIKELGYDVKLDTNGTNPDMLRRLLDNHLLDYIAMDIKAGRKNYAIAAGIFRNTPLIGKSGSGFSRSLLSRVQRSIDIIRNSGIDYEFRTTVVKGIHTEEDFEDIARWLADRTESAADTLGKRFQVSCFVSNLPAEASDSVSGLSDKPVQASSSAGKQLRYYLQSFRDCDTILLPNHHFSAFTEEEMLRFLAIIKKTIPNASLRGMEL